MLQVEHYQGDDVMKNSDSTINKIYSYFTAVRGNNTPVQQQRTLAVLKKDVRVGKGIS